MKEDGQAAIFHKPVNRFSIYFQFSFSSHPSLPEHMKYPTAGTLRMFHKGTISLIHKGKATFSS